jgi:hypothetical protein
MISERKSYPTSPSNSRWLVTIATCRSPARQPDRVSVLGPVKNSPPLAKMLLE